MTNTGKTHASSGNWPDRSAVTTSTFLKLGLSGPRRPVDELIAWLDERDARQWLSAALVHGPLGDAGQDLQVLASGSVDLDVLKAMKRHGTAELKKAGIDNEQRMLAIAEYFISIAAAIHHHGEVLTNRDREEVRMALLDLATATPPHLADLLGEAALKVSDV